MHRQRLRRAGGFTYLSLIILVAIIGLVAATTLKLGAAIQRSKAEQELLRIGAAFSDALQSYADATPAGQSTQPPSFKELLRDPRFPTPRRHLRKVFVDPMTGRDEWGVVYLGDKTGIMAIYSLSDAKPIKVGNFEPRFQSLAGKQKISDWRFGASTLAAPTNAAPTGGKPGGQPSLQPGAQHGQTPAPAIEPAPPIPGDPSPQQEMQSTPEPPPLEPEVEPPAIPDKS